MTAKGLPSNYFYNAGFININDMNHYHVSLQTEYVQTVIAFVWMKDCDKLTVKTKLLAVSCEMIAMTTRTDTDIDSVMMFTKIPFNLTLRFST